MHPAKHVLFLSHGGGPMPLLGGPEHIDMVTTLQEIAASIPKPDAIIVISAHWEAAVPTITASEFPSLIYDYSGFPKASYTIQYPCPGEPVLAGEVAESINRHGLEVRLDTARGFDHGLFVPLKIMYPDADIPCIQLSLVNTLDPALHIQIGLALQDLSRSNLFIIGSGFSFHNLRSFFSPDGEQGEKMNDDFERWLIDTCSNIDYSEKERRQKLLEWSEAPGARYCHPREEHLIPLHVCYGVAQQACSTSYEITVMNKKSSMYLWKP